MPDEERYNKALKSFEDRFWSTLEEGYPDDYWFQQYRAFSGFIQALFISENGYIIDTGNFENVNLELIHLIKEKVERHPHIFSKLFMVG